MEDYIYENITAKIGKMTAAELDELTTQLVAYHEGRAERISVLIRNKQAVKAQAAQEEDCFDEDRFLLCAGG